MPKLKIFVSSTCYDLSIIREQLRKFILDFGYEPVMSDYNDVLYDPRNHTHTSCIKEIPYIDLIILIIGGRYGGKAVQSALDLININELKTFSTSTKILESKNISITQLEILKAVELKIPIFVFVDKAVMNDHLFYEMNKKNPNFLDNVVFPSIEKKETAIYIFEFINFLRHRGHNNSIFEYDSYEKIIDTIKKQWSNLFQRLLYENKANLNVFGKSSLPNNSYPEVYGISYSYNDTDWQNLLENTHAVDFCVLYKYLQPIKL